MHGLTIAERKVRNRRCPDCGRAFEHVTGFVADAAGAHSVYFAACHGHPEHEAQIDVVLGTWGGPDASDHLTFSCLLRPDGAMAVDATVAVAASRRDPLIGRRLTRAEALSHPWVTTFWQVVDVIATEDASVTRLVGSG